MDYSRRMRHVFRFRNPDPDRTDPAGSPPAASRRGRAATAVAACTLAIGAVAVPAVAEAAPRGASGGHGTFAPGTYTNPISKDFADTYADPAVIKAKDGWWYAYATSDPLVEGGPFGNMHVARSRDLVSWTYVGEIFGEGAARPTWAAENSFFWAPDIRYLNGRYLLYYTVTETADEAGLGGDSSIGVATSPTPYGPWTDSGAPVIAPRDDPNNPNPAFFWTFDPAQFTDTDGQKYLYFGSYYGGIHVTRLSDDGLRRVGESTQVTIPNRYEGAYVVREGDWYYLFGSSANCCAGPTTGYSVSVGRSRSPLGPFVDREGSTLLESRVGGTPVITPNGNRWIGTGHNAVATDYSGQDWFVYHALDRADPFLTEPFGINERPMLMDRLDWIDGWPVVRGGAFASEGEERAPWGQPRAGDDFNDDAIDGFDHRRGQWRVVDGPGGGAVKAPGSKGAALLTRVRNPADVRAEADVRLTGGTAAGVVVRRRSHREYAAAWIDRRAGALVTDVVVDGRHHRRTTDLGDSFRFGEWHNVAVEVRGLHLYAEVTDARLNDPYAVAHRTLPAALADGRRAGVVAKGRAQADNVGVTPLYVPNTTRAGTPTVGSASATHSDEFGDTALGPEWSWVRTPDGAETGGSFVWTTQGADLVGPGGGASVLLRDAPAGNYVVETKLTMDLGVDVNLNYRQAGLIAYASDDLWARFTHVAIWETRQLEFGKEQPFAPGLSFGGITAFPAPQDTTWLRLAHRVDPDNGEHEYRAGMSTDGEHWTWGGVWTLPADTTPRIGLISLGGAGSTASFDYFRVYTGGAWNG
jgi:beta-xylosidase